MHMSCKAFQLATHEPAPIASADAGVEGDKVGIAWTPGHQHSSPTHTHIKFQKPDLAI